MRRVYKYALLEASNDIELPEEVKITLVGPDPNGNPCVWLEVDPDATLIKQTIHVFGTGHDIEDPDLEHIGSCVIGLFVWHMYIDRDPYSALK